MSQEDGLMKTAAWLSAGGECVSFADGEERLWSIDSEVYRSNSIQNWYSLIGVAKGMAFMV